jgi:hypothetical protein
VSKIDTKGNGFVLEINTVFVSKIDTYKYTDKDTLVGGGFLMIGFQEGAWCIRIIKTQEFVLRT